MKVHLTTLGCPKNQVDSELMLGMLARAGVEVAATPAEADCLVVNTCAFLDRAREESVGAILELAGLKDEGRSRSLIVTGCLSQRYGRELLAELPEVDAILGTGELERIVELVAQVRGRKDWVEGAPPGYLYDAATPRPGNGDIGDLLLALSDTAVPWIRPMYLHPAHVNDRLLAKWQRARVLPYLDMPIQHGDDEILRRMWRGVTACRMKEIFEAFRAAVPGVTLRTTVLVGFPGESEAHFQNLLDFIEDVRFDRLGVFTYSLEDGTPAATMADQVPPEVMAERARIVQDAQDRIARGREERAEGTVQTVLVDGPSEDPAFLWEGRMAGQAPEIDGVVYLCDRSLTPGRFARVRIVEVEGYELVGESAD